MPDNIDKWDSRLEYIHYENSKDIDVPDEIYIELKYINPFLDRTIIGPNGIQVYKNNILRVNIGKI